MGSDHLQVKVEAIASRLEAIASEHSKGFVACLFDTEKLMVAKAPPCCTPDLLPAFAFLPPTKLAFACSTKAMRSCPVVDAARPIYMLLKGKSENKHHTIRNEKHRLPTRSTACSIATTFFSSSLKIWRSGTLASKKVLSTSVLLPSSLLSSLLSWRRSRLGWRLSLFRLEVIASRNKKLVVTSATLLGTSALLVVTRS